MSEVIRRQQMNPVVEVVEAMMERRRQRSSFFLRLSRENLMRRNGERSQCRCLCGGKSQDVEKALIHSNRKEYEVERDICVK